MPICPLMMEISPSLCGRIWAMSSRMRWRAGVSRRWSRFRVSNHESPVWSQRSLLALVLHRGMLVERRRAISIDPHR